MNMWIEKFNNGFRLKVKFLAKIFKFCLNLVEKL